MLYFGEYYEGTTEIFVISLNELLIKKENYSFECYEHYLMLFEEYVEGLLKCPDRCKNKKLITYNGRIYYVGEAEHMWEFVKLFHDEIFNKD